jgi:uncharacterized protein
MKKIIINTEVFIREYFQNDSSGHDWYHMERVRNNALKIHQGENQGNPFIIEMAALLHDYLDEKLQDDMNQAHYQLEQFLSNQGLVNSDIIHILEIITSISYRGGNEAQLSTIEAKIVRDADRLDAIGAVGIARAFAYGGMRGNLIYEPALSTRDTMTITEYRQVKTSTIHHFYEKLLKLKDLMQTETGKQLAEHRHEYMEEFLEQFFKEWNGE